jgi:hypothetical protein
MAEVAAELRHIAGVVDGLDGKAKIERGTGFRVTNVETGRYHVTFTTPFNNLYGACATLVRVPLNLSTVDNAQVTKIENDSILVLTGNNSGDYTDQMFSFIVVGI